jgi:very-short-patch-repair endonuclease
MQPNRWTPARLQRRAWELRQQMTPAEAALWTRLRRKQICGLRFRRQHVIGPHIVDFCCVQARLVVEVDGSVHDELEEHDEARDAALQALGYRVLHVRNEEVIEQMKQVLQTITAAYRDVPAGDRGEPNALYI